MFVSMNNALKKELIADTVIQSIPIIDDGEPLVDIASLGIVQYSQHIEIELKSILVRKTVLKKLLKAESLLPDGFRLQLYEGYISLRRQKNYFDEKFEIVRQKHPEFSLEEAFAETTKSA